MSEPTILEDYLELVTYGFTNPMPDADEGPWKITAKDVIGGEINFNTARKTTQEAYDTKLTKKSRPKIGDVLLTKDGTLGRLAIVQQEGLCINQSVAVLRPNQKILPEYLFYLLSTPDYQRQMIGDSDGTVIKHIYITRVGKMEVDIPSIEVQKARLKHLIALDGKIKNNRQTNKTLEHIAQALFKCWFVDFEPTRAKMIAKEKGANSTIQELAAQAIICGAMTLEQLEAITQNLEITLQQAINEKLSQANQTPINTEQLKTTAALFPNELVESELGEIPEGWKVVKNGDVMDVRDGTHDSPKQSERGFPLVTSKHITTGILDLKSAYLISEEDYEKVNNRSKVNQGDILLTMIGTVGLSYLVMQPVVNFAIKNVALFRTSAVKELKNYFYLLLKSSAMKTYLDARMAGTTQKYLSLKTLRSIDMLMPPADLLGVFNLLVNPMMERVFALQEESDGLMNIRDTLLPKLLSGELNVSSD